ncbi:MAG: phenol hydroxylase subunit P4 [Gammaproteobacteria bacterium]|nr:phenol hydroxylase subunit P4 [Gammaproteobacteria bacterium]MBU1602720.1 phenol hydroxylase subunit P4 [Gammaproteobacteria bacterium]MBU2433525.1 phenol hydroxylase subunit P4 [Gammaproteobacteria bacterium]MBU2451441.1 phenol hydroxylase subunit P4 [Gammaproteobacteria bacterium]
MALTSTKPYVGVPRDLVQNFNGKQIVYVCWDHHMLFATPLMLVVEPEMSFGDLLENVVKPLIGADPDAAVVDLTKVEWLKSGRSWAPDFGASLAVNGIVHKEQLRFSTPGVNSLLAAA